MTNRELIMLLLNRDIDAEVMLQVKTDDECDVSFGEAFNVYMYNGMIYISEKGAE